MYYVAHVRKPEKKKKHVMLCCTQMMYLLLRPRASHLCFLLVRIVTNDDYDNVFVMSILLS